MNSEIKEETKKEETIKAEIKFFLIDGCCHVNSITTTQSGIVKFEKSLSESFSKQEGALLIKGTPDSEDDFILIPPRSILAITFKIIRSVV